MTQPIASAKTALKTIEFIWQHPANEGHSLEAVLRAFRFQLGARLLNRRAVARLGDHSEILVDLHRTSATKVLYANPPDYPEMLTWRRRVKPGGLFFDVGANIGSYSILLAEIGASVTALEPAPDTFELLAENIAINGYDISAVRAAAGSFNGTISFSAGADSLNRIDPNGSMVVPLVTLDLLLGDRVADGVKIDVEGFEIDVLRGCEASLAERRIKLIQLEWNEACRDAVDSDRQPVADLLAKYGYRLFRPDRSGTLQPIDRPGFGPDVFASPDL